jgi:hypothetical protein
MEDLGDDQERVIRWQWQHSPSQGQLTVCCQATKMTRVDTCADLAQGPTESVVWRVVKMK